MLSATKSNSCKGKHLNLCSLPQNPTVVRENILTVLNATKSNSCTTLLDPVAKVNQRTVILLMEVLQPAGIILFCINPNSPGIFARNHSKNLQDPSTCSKKVP